MFLKKGNIAVAIKREIIFYEEYIGNVEKQNNIDREFSPSIHSTDSRREQFDN